MTIDYVYVLHHVKIEVEVKNSSDSPKLISRRLRISIPMSAEEMSIRIAKWLVPLHCSDKAGRILPLPEIDIPVLSFQIMLPCSNTFYSRRLCTGDRHCDYGDRCKVFGFGLCDSASRRAADNVSLLNLLPCVPIP